MQASTASRVLVAGTHMVISNWRRIRRGMLAYMQRTTVKLPDELDARLRHEAKRRGTTVSELTREAIEAILADEANTSH